MNFGKDFYWGMATLTAFRCRGRVFCQMVRENQRKMRKFL